jgi:hypothetical protein
VRSKDEVWGDSTFLSGVENIVALGEQGRVSGFFTVG